MIRVGRRVAVVVLRSRIPPGRLLAAVLIGLALVAAACGGGSGSGASSERPDPGPRPDLPVNEPAEGGYLPAVTVRDVTNNRWVQLANLLPADKPMLVWFWAPH